MQTNIQKLQDRYGKNHDYVALSEQQTAFLLNHIIKNNSDACGEDTVSIKGIYSDPNYGTLVELLDIHYYAFRRNNQHGKNFYTADRIRDYRQVLGITDTENPTKLEDESYLFELEDSRYKIRATFDSIKDRA